MVDQVGTFKIGPYSCEGKKALIGKGSFADVYKAENTTTGEIVAIKVIDVARLTRGSEKLKKHLASEISIMKKMDNPNIVRLFDIFTPSESHIYMIFEYCSGGDFAKYLSKHKRLSEAKTQYFMRQLANGLKFLRSKNIIHRDLKPQNLLLTSNDENAVLKIADFGFARFIEPQSVADTLCGSPLYMAPEILKLQKYTVKTDLWSVGAIMFEMLTGQPPFPAKSQIELMRLVDSKKRFDMPRDVKLSEDCLSLVDSLLQQDPLKRISWEEFFLHPWLGLHSVLTDSASFTTSTSGTSALTSSGAPSLASLTSNLALSPPMGSTPPIPVSMERLERLRTGSSAPVPITSPTFGLMLSNAPIETSPLNFVGSPPPVSVGAFAQSKYSSPPEPLSSSQPMHHQFKLRTTSFGNTPPDMFSVGSPTGPSPPVNMPRSRSSSGMENNSLSQSGGGIPIPKTRPFKDSIIGSSHQYSQSLPTTLQNSAGSNSGSVTASGRAESFPPTGLVASFGKDSFDKDYVVVDSDNSPDFTDASMYMNDIKRRHKRVGAIVKLADSKLDIENFIEGLSLYIKALQVLHTLIHQSKTSPHTEKAEVSFAINRIKEYYKDLLRKADVIKTRVPDTTPVLTERLMYESALSYGREGAVGEVLKNLDKSIGHYTQGILLLEQLLSEATDELDKEILQKYISNFNRRLNEVHMMLHRTSMPRFN